MSKIKYVYLNPKIRQIPHLPIEYIDPDIDIEEHNKQAKEQKTKYKLDRKWAQSSESLRTFEFLRDRNRNRFFQET